MDNTPDDREEGEFLYNDEEEVVIPPYNIVRFFNIEDYQSLLCKSLSALDLKDSSTGKDDKDADHHPKNKAWGSRNYFPKDMPSEKVCPFLVFFERQMRAEWIKTTANRQCSQLHKKLYNLPPFAHEILQVPLVDAPVLAIQSSGLLSEDGQGFVKDVWDCRMDTTLRQCHEATVMAIKVCATASVISRASIVWGKKMIELLPESETRLREGASCILKASSFTADATLDALIFSSQAMASSTVARREVWL